MRKDITKVFKDVENISLPKDLNNLSKIHCSLSIGQRVYWYYQEDLDFANDHGIDVKKDFDIYSGIVIPVPDIDVNTELMGGGDTDTIIIMDQYPTEKENCQYTWIAINRLIDDYNLIEVFSRD